MFVHLIWRLLNTRYEERIHRLGSSLNAEGERVLPTINRRKRTGEEIAQEFFDRYAERIKAAWAVGKAFRKPVFQVLQPNQYFEGSKVLSREEREVAVSDEIARKLVNAYYPRLRTMSADLRGEGIPSYDLTMIFENNDQHLYYDACCHMNDLGMELLADGIIEQIRRDPLTEIIPPYGSS
jgi:hypothetical protein